MRDQLKRAVGLIVIAALPVVGLSAAPQAWAGDEVNTGGSTTPADPPPSTSAGGGGSGGSINAHVTTTTNYKASSGMPLSPVNVDWKPPGCWYEPRFTPEQYQDYFRKSMIGWGTGKQYVYPELKALEDAKYNQGKDGLWWQRVYNENVPAGYALANCPQGDPEVWVPTGDPAPPPGVLTPKDLKDIAYAATRLPNPPVQLSPAAGSQVVNLPTFVKFTQNLDPVRVTARISAPAYGVDIAATTVATPVALRVDAGTDDASPGSCTYDLTRAGSGYQVDSSSAGCNITYRRTGSYQLHAQITWRVTWTPSADPNGPAADPPLPDGLSTYDQPVTVKEIQTVVR